MEDDSDVSPNEVPPASGVEGTSAVVDGGQQLSEDRAGHALDPGVPRAESTGLDTALGPGTNERSAGAEAATATALSSDTNSTG